MKATLSSKLAILAVFLSSVTSVSAALSCPENNGDPVIVPGKRYKLICNHAHGAAGTIPKSPCTSIEQCAQYCAEAGPDCLHGQFNFRKNECLLRTNVGDRVPTGYASGHVLLWEADEPIPSPKPIDTGDTAEKPIGGDTGTGTGTGAGTGLDSRGNKLVYTCPADNGELYEAENGRVLKLHCSHGSHIADIDSFASTSLQECAARCGLRTDCKQIDFDGSTCHIKGATAEPKPWSGHVWVSHSCPKKRATAAVKKPLQTTDLTCPQSDGKIFEGSDGTWFYSQCCTDADGATILGFKAATSQKDCAELCVKDKTCKSALFVPESPHPENCKLYGHGTFSTTYAEGAHYVYVTDPPTEAAKLSEAKTCSTECPGADGQIYASVTGENYQMFCKKRHGTNYLKIERRPSFESCIAACAATPACDSADYEPRTKKCFFSNNNNLPTIDAPAFMSAHSLGCAGACASCNKDKGCGAATKEALGADEATCPDNDGELVTAGLEDFRLQCKHCWTSHVTSAGATSSWTVPGASLADCSLACAKDTRCVGVNFMHADKICSMHPARALDGSEPNFTKSDKCHALSPIDRGFADKTPSS